MKKILKENLGSIIFLIFMALILMVELPYYVEAPGGTINLTQRMDKDYQKDKGSLNMLYVTEYKGNIVTVVLSKFIKSWDLYKISEQQINNEDAKEIYTRNRIMLDNSIQNATLVAYNYAEKSIEIEEKQNVVIAVTKENGLKIGDIILSIDNEKIENVNSIRNYLNSLNVGDSITVTVNRNNVTKKIDCVIEEDKLLGVMVVTNYVYNNKDDLNINFKNGEGGASGGLVLSLGIYSEITGIDLLKGRNIAGTGTIDEYGNVGEIDGVKYKIAGAVKNKMDLVLVSPYNYEEAIKVANENNYNIKIVKVNTFEEAVEYLKK